MTAYSYGPDDDSELRREALRIARSLGETEVLLSVLLFIRWGFIGTETREELRSQAELLAAHAETTTDAEQALQALLLRVSSLNELGDVKASGQALDELASRAEVAGSPWFGWFATRLRVFAALQAGRFAEAESLAVLALSFEQRMDHHEGWQSYHSISRQRNFARYHAGCADRSARSAPDQV